MTTQEFFSCVTLYHRANPAQRYGQAVFNTAINLSWTSAAANQMRSTNVDPFYDDIRIASFVDGLGLIN